MTKKASVAALGILLIACAAPALAETPCRLLKSTSLELGTDRAGGVYVPVTIGGRKLNLLVDTGGIYSMLTDQTVKSMGLRQQHMARVQLRMYGGALIDSYVTADNLVLGQLTAPRWKFLVMPNGMPIEINGTLSPDILRNYDADFDFAASKLNLFSQDHCPGKVVYWTHGTVAQIPVDLDMWGHLKVPVELDGKKFEAAIDTGSDRSVMSLDTAEEKFGFNEGDARLKRAARDPDEPAHVYTFPFRTLALEGVTVANPDVMLVPDRDSHIGSHGPGLILGMGILRQLHLYIAYKESKLYVTAATAGGGTILADFAADSKEPAADPAAAPKQLAADAAAPSRELAADLSAAAKEPPPIPVSLRCTNPAIEGQFTADGPPGFASAKVAFAINSPPPSGAVQVSQGSEAVCTVRASEGTAIESSSFDIDFGDSDAAFRRELLKHVEIQEEVTNPGAQPAGKAFVFRVKANDSASGKLVLEFPVRYR